MCNHAIGPQGAFWWNVELGPRQGKKRRADMIMVGRVVMAAGTVVRMAMVGMKGAVVSLGHHCPGAMLDGLGCRGRRKA